MKRSNQVSAEKQLRFLSQSARLEESVNPRIVRASSWMICLSIAAFIAWSAVTHVNEIARVPGEVVPQGFQQIIQHLEGGLVREIRVAEGDLVEKGQILLILDGAGIQEDLERSKSDRVFLEMQRERLKAFVENRQPDFSMWVGDYQALVIDQEKIFQSMIDNKNKEKSVVNDQISQKKQSIAVLNARADMVRKNLTLSKDMYARQAGLYQQGYISHTRFMAIEQDVNSLKGESNIIANEVNQVKEEINEYEARLKSLDARHHDEAWQQLNQIEAQLAQNREVLEKMNNRVERLEIAAPVRGLVKGINVNTIGGVVQPGQSLMEIIPLDRDLVVELRIPPQHVGHLKPGVPVHLKVSTFDFSRYGSIPGKLEFISPTTYIGDRGERFYRGRVKLDRNYAGKDPKSNIVLPGMTVMADMVTGDKTVLAYLVKPVYASMQTALSER